MTGPRGATAPRRVGLSKSRFTAGLQCLRMLWWKVHEPEAPELVPDDSLAALFATGHKVGARAQAEFPGGVLIERDGVTVDEAIAATERALASDAPAIFEGAFRADSVLVYVDILERKGKGWVLVEVKATTSQKPQHVPDAAVQFHVLRRAGVNVTRAEVMHLNPEHRHPDTNPLFVRADVTAEAKELLEDIPQQIVAQLAALQGAVPEAAPGDHCTDPYECAFMARCWPEKPEHHVSELYRIGKKAAALEEQGYEVIGEVPADELNETQSRQHRAVVSKKAVVERGLSKALAKLAEPIAHLDFETINPALPVWNGCKPYEQLPVQFSVHHHANGGVGAHHPWLAEGAADPRAALADALLEATDGAKTVLAWHASFEAGCIDRLADALPKQRKHLEKLKNRLVDLLPIYRDHVYHPEQHGSFSLKAVVPALLPELAYDDLEVSEGGTASTLLQTLILDSDSIPAADRAKLRTALLAYCERDTLVMVNLLEKLRGMAG